MEEHFKTFHHKISTGENVKFTIKSTSINGEKYYLAYIINTDLEVYQKLSDIAKEAYEGITATNGKGSILHYKNPIKFEDDLKMFYGSKWLETEV